MTAREQDVRVLVENANSPLPSFTEARLQLLVETGLQLAQQREHDVIVQTALDAGRELCGAAIGAFFYTGTGADGETYESCKVSGAEANDFRSVPMPRPTASLAGLGHGAEGTVRLGDVLQDVRYGRNLPFFGLPVGHPPVRSYLRVPVRGREGEILGTMLFGHPVPHVFAPDVELLVETVASQAAAALENARLTKSVHTQMALADAAQQLQQLTASRLRQALDAAGLGTFTWDRASDLLDMDERAAELFHTKPNVPVSRSMLRDRMVLPEDRELTMSRLREALEAGGSYRAEYRVTAPDGAVSWISASGVATHGQGGVSGMTGVVQDITERKNQEGALRQSEKLAATGRLAATIAHEINNPLEAVTNLLYLVKTDPELPPHLAEMMQTADGELARIGVIAQQTLGFYRDTSQPVEIDLSALLSAITQLFARKLVSKRLQCTLDLEPSLKFFGFAGEIRQIFSNLLVNAIDATSSGTIHMRARSRAFQGHPGVVVLVSDPGTGIPRHLHKRMFMPFFTTKETVGTGLGLWVTRGMVEKHGGKIHFRSRTHSPSGTVFRVHLPQTFAAKTHSSFPSATVIQ